jgi:Domain of unknown function (DUF1772)
MSRHGVLNVLLWWSVIGLALWVGGTVFNIAVVVPMWSTAPPDSVRHFFTQTRFNETIWNFFGPPWMAMRLLPVIAALIVAWPLERHRRYLLVASACLAATVVFTVAYVYRINDLLFAQAGATVTADEVRSLVRQWILADRLRFAVGCVAFGAVLQAFRVPQETTGGLRRPGRGRPPVRSA